MRRLLTLLGTVLIAVLLAGAAGCGGDDDDGTDTSDEDGRTSAATLEPAGSGDDEEENPTEDGGDDDTGGDSNYYNQLADILNEADRTTNQIAQEYGGPYDDDADEIDQTKAAFNETGQVVEGVLLALADLQPPAEAEDAHQAYFDSLQEFTILMSQFSGELEDVTNGDELSDLEDEYNSQLVDGSGQVETDCLALQDLADAADSGADLGCSEQN